MSAGVTLGAPRLRSTQYPCNCREEITSCQERRQTHQKLRQRHTWCINWRNNEEKSGAGSHHTTNERTMGQWDKERVRSRKLRSNRTRCHCTGWAGPMLGISHYLSEFVSLQGPCGVVSTLSSFNTQRSRSQRKGLLDIGTTVEEQPRYPQAAIPCHTT